MKEIHRFKQQAFFSFLFFFFFCLTHGPNEFRQYCSAPHRFIKFIHRGQIVEQRNVTHSANFIPKYRMKLSAVELVLMIHKEHKNIYDIMINHKSENIGLFYYCHFLSDQSVDCLHQTLIYDSILRPTHGF